jgi:mannose-1-phosphate guanylyltransferase
MARPGSSVGPSPLWTVVLAAGAGRRLSGLTNGTPKQFWSPGGGPSLVEQTLLRLGPLAEPAATVTVIQRAHRSHLSALVHRSLLGQVVEQPCDRGTAAGLLAGLAAVAAASPDALVLVMPCDHGVARPGLFRRGVARAAAAVRAGRADVVLFGVEPDRATEDYGWITPRPTGRWTDEPVRPVAAFVEKPARSHAARLLASGAVWNTMILVGRVQTLIDLYRRHLPDLTEVFARAWRLPPDRRDAFLVEQYPHLSNTDLSRDVLTLAEGLVVYTWPASLGWTDLGTPERFDHWSRPDVRHPRGMSAATA